MSAGPRARLRGLTLTAALLLAAPGTAAPAALAQAQDKPVPAVAASIPPVHSLVAGVMRGIGQPRLLIPGGASPHDAPLRPSDATAIARARAVFWIGPSLEASLAKPLAALSASAFSVPLAAAEGIQTLTLAGGGTDPHVWLDPVNAAAMVRTIVIVMATVDPDRAVRYRSNGSEVLLGLGRLEAELRQTLAPVAGIRFLSFHEAYGHLSRRFGLAAAGAVAVDAERPPGARRVRQLRRQIQDEGIACLFTEAGTRPPLARTLIEGTGARLGELDPLGADLAPGPGLYGAMMRALAGSLARCLGRP